MGYSDPVRQAEYQAAWVAKRRAAWFVDKSCAICGSTVDLEIDHIDQNHKSSHRIWSWSQERRAVELAKCQVLCGLHHKEKTRLCAEHSRGQTNGQSKLTEQQVIEIRDKFAFGATKRGLAREYGIDEKAIRALLRGDTWKHI